MIRVRTGKVVAIDTSEEHYTTVQIDIHGTVEPAVNYHHLTGDIRVGDTVILNTTAHHLRLGTGGTHFVMAIEGRERDVTHAGHIMKCRYTPSQVAVHCVEEENSPHHHVVQDGSLENVPVIAASLHSMVAAAAVAARTLGGDALRITYIMTDGGALPAYHSKLLKDLKHHGYINDVITCGHAFGGDYEAVTVYSALLAAYKVCRADLIIAAMGPGNVGTGTTWGTTALEQGAILNAAAILEGKGIAAPRISFADPRSRHYGISHHAQTTLGRIVHQPCLVALPYVTGDLAELLRRQLSNSGILAKHNVYMYDASFIISLLQQSAIQVKTMGRTPQQDPAPFVSAAAAAMMALEAPYENVLR